MKQMESCPNRVATAVLSALELDSSSVPPGMKGASRCVAFISRQSVHGSQTCSTRHELTAGNFLGEHT